eukprot:TRINITY_DN101_c0_g1_i6.p2 TRINITY_DN101_c0_g1~~TRINITY_DN101_c0_g1_i6.p2  ORF type:complete len:152 (-),score=56.68 TRINITY_DN101_c0_g1_i6:223-678(-)
MTMHSVVATTRSGDILFSQYFLSPSEDQKQLYETQLSQATSHNWASLKDDADQIAVLGEVVVVYTAMDDILLFAAGSGLLDEISLWQHLQSFVRVVREVSKKPYITEQHFADREVYAKVCLIVDEMFFHGVVDHTDPELVRNLVKLKVGPE